MHTQAKAAVDFAKVDVAKKNKIPMFLYHGSEDETNKIKDSQKSFDFLRKNGINMEIQIELGLHHLPMSKKEFKAIHKFITN